MSEVSEACRERLPKESDANRAETTGQRGVLHRWGYIWGHGPGRGLTIVKERGGRVNGTVIKQEGLNPAFEEKIQHVTRQRKLAEGLSLWLGFQD